MRISPWFLWFLFSSCVHPAKTQAPHPSPQEAVLASWTGDVRALVAQALKELEFGDLEATVHLWIEPESGKILRLELASSSGVDAFDTSALELLEGLAGLPSPPESLWSLLRAEYITLRLCCCTDQENL